jgi:hypothetical protein
MYGGFIFRKNSLGLSFWFLLVLYIITITYTIIVATTIGAELSNLLVCLYKIALFLFIICLFILPSSVQEILTSAGPKRKIRENINNLFITVPKVQDFSHLDDELKAEQFSDNEFETQVSQLRETFALALKENEQETAKFILSIFTEGLKNFINNNRYISINMNDFLDLLRDFSDEAFRMKSDSVLKANLKSIGEIRRFSTKHRPEFSLLVSIDIMIREILFRVIKEDLTSVCVEGFETLRDNLYEDLQNYPLFAKDKLNKTRFKEVKYHEEHFVEVSYLTMFYHLINRAIEFERLEIIREGFRYIQEILIAIVVSDKMGSDEKEKFFEKCYANLKTLTQKCLDKGIYNFISDALLHTFGAISYFLTKDTYLYEKPTKHFIEALVEIAKKGLVDVNYQEIGLQYMYKIGVTCIEKLDEPNFLNILSVIIEGYQAIIDNLDITKAVDDTSAKNKIYSLIFYSLKAILDLMKDKNKHNYAIEEKIISILNNFEDT